MTFRILFSAVALALTATPALAHLNPGEHGSFAAGFTHPVFGLDHILAMVAVGLWAGSVGGRALWAVPGAFVAAMALGFAWALAGGWLPFVEPAILASVVALGLLVAFAVRLPVLPSAFVVAAFALFHGFAHGGEMGAATALSYALGFTVATALLHGIGLGLGLAITRALKEPRIQAAATRAFGAATAAAGVVLILA